MKSVFFTGNGYRTSTIRAPPPPFKNEMYESVLNTSVFYMNVFWKGWGNSTVVFVTIPVSHCIPLVNDFIYPERRMCSSSDLAPTSTSSTFTPGQHQKHFLSEELYPMCGYTSIKQIFINLLKCHISGSVKKVTSLLSSEQPWGFNQWEGTIRDSHKGQVNVFLFIVQSLKSVWPYWLSSEFPDW